MPQPHLQINYKILLDLDNVGNQVQSCPILQKNLEMTWIGFGLDLIHFNIQRLCHLDWDCSDSQVFSHHVNTLFKSASENCAVFSLRYPLALFKQDIALEDNELYEPGLMRYLDNVRNQVHSDF